tara:strand:+ start:564 stop:1643 length:1080 start_codon:yes stop_codon:yes gene_type:complete
MITHDRLLFVLMNVLLLVLFLSRSVSGAESDTGDIQNDVMDVTLFRGAANNTWFEVYFNAVPVEGAEKVEMENLEINLRPERDVTLYVEVFNPSAQIPLVITPGGNGDTNGFGNFARNVAAAAPDLKVIIYDRRNLGQSEVSFGLEPQMVEEGEDLHVLIDRLGVAPVSLYGMSSGGRSNLLLSARYPNDVAALVLAPLTGGPLASARLAEEYFLKYLHDEQLVTMDHISDEPITTIEDLSETPLWSAYLERNSTTKQQRFFNQNIDDFLKAMKTSGEHLKATGDQVALGMNDDELPKLEIPSTLILHHGSYIDYLHPITNTRAAITLIPNSSFAFASYLPEILDVLLPFVREHTPELN